MYKTYLLVYSTATTDVHEDRVGSVEHADVMNQKHDVNGIMNQNHDVNDVMNQNHDVNDIMNNHDVNRGGKGFL